MFYYCLLKLYDLGQLTNKHLEFYVIANFT